MKRKILIIEDEASIADTLVYALQKEGFDPLWRSTGTGGLELIQSEGISFVILDLGLPDVDGFDLLKKIRAFSGLPILILSARSEDVDRIVGLEVGADDFVTKPFSPREIGARVRAILRRFDENRHPPVATETATATKNSVPGQDAGKGMRQTSSLFYIDEPRKMVYYCNTPLLLSRYEYDILTLLVRRPGWVFSREQIMDLVWEEPEESFDRVVDTHIKNIRAKLKAIRKTEDPIITRRGIGYSLRE